ncbi:MAG: hypothetical protein ACRC6M_19310 [Microcystaceae cyanobacterium]
MVLPIIKSDRLFQVQKGDRTFSPTEDLVKTVGVQGLEPKAYF